MYTFGYIFVYRYYEQPAYLCIIHASAVVPSKKDFYMQVCVHVAVTCTPYTVYLAAVACLVIMISLGNIVKLHMFF